MIFVLCVVCGSVNIMSRLCCSFGCVLDNSFFALMCFIFLFVCLLVCLFV